MARFEITLAIVAGIFLSPIALSGQTCTNYLDDGESTVVDIAAGKVSYKIKSNEKSLSMVPSTAVVIPEDMKGGVEVILESSTDPNNWTRADAGVYGSFE